MYTLNERITENKIPYVYVENIPRLNIFKTFDCGQCFRFDPVSMFGNKYEFGGVAFGKYVVFAQNNDTEIIVYGANGDDFEKIWAPFLSLDVDYELIDKSIIDVSKSDHMTRATEYSRGIRILRQDMWESLCSFIISQNNNIPRIKKIIATMCEKYGDKINFYGSTHYSFPSAEVLYNAGVDAMFELKTGFRAKYIHDAATRVFDGEIVLDTVKESDFDSALLELSKIKGVGLKVASCALLFGFEKTEAFPIDVWMKRAIDRHFGGSFDHKALGKHAGIAQQYLFYYEKYNSLPLEDGKKIQSKP
ncbi:MAG: DNA-3-methyladenine glycosylase 2 family protein [Clostridia bacterium]|nr:DNA-3-methyladenine glycosylase 2 family protein [Clostridia bacterium]